MSILDMTNLEELDIRSKRIEANLYINSGEGLGQELRRVAVRASIQGNGTLRFLNDPVIDNSMTSYIKEYQQDGIITSMQCDDAEIKRITELTSDTITNNFECVTAEISLCSIMKDVNIEVTKKHQIGQVRPSRVGTVSFDMCYNIKFDNVNINFEVPHNGVFPQRRLQFHSCDTIDFSGLKSNVEEISHYILDVFPSELSRLFDDTHICCVYDRQKNAEVEIPVKHMKKAIAITNNPKRYELESFIWTLKKGAKLSDILPIENFPDLEIYAVHNNNVQLTFVKKGSESCRVFNFSRTPKNTGNMDDMYEITADGWYVIWSTRY